MIKMVSICKTTMRIALMIVSFHSVLSTVVGHAARVLELSDRFLEVRKEGVWLVKFYAPWCGHCKRLEPIFNHVAQALYDTNIRVAKVDCTRFPSVATEFGVRGFPTIMFIRGDRVSTYNGERITEDIVDYAKKMNGPHITETSQSPADIQGHYFGYVGPREGLLWEEYEALAKENQDVDRYFFFTDETPVGSEATVISKKSNGMMINFTDADSLKEFVTSHRFDSFMRTTRSNFHKLIQTKKWIVMGVISEDKLGRSPSHHLEFRSVLGGLVDSIDLRQFQLTWTTAEDFISKFVAREIETPYLIVINSTNYEHHLLLSENEGWSIERIQNFMDLVAQGKTIAAGGNTLLVRLYRTFYELKSNLIDMWVGNPILTTVLFGLPLGFLSLIVYSIFCADFMDEDESVAEAEDYKNHEKRD